MRTAALYKAELLSGTASEAEAAASLTAASAAASSPLAFCFACSQLRGMSGCITGHCRIWT